MSRSFPNTTPRLARPATESEQAQARDMVVGEEAGEIAFPRSRRSGRMPDPLGERLHRLSRWNGACLEWIGAKHLKGYGHIQIGGRGFGAHRVSYVLAKGLIPPGLQLDHLCRNPSCINPDHLEPVTPRENTLRGNSLWGQNARKTHCPQGHPYSGSNLRVHPKGRTCRACDRAKQAVVRARKKAERLAGDAR